MKRTPRSPEAGAGVWDFPLRIVTRATLIYFVLSGLWILISDLALEALLRDPAAITKVQTYKGFAFVFVSSGILFVVWRRQLNRWFAEHAALKQAEKSLLFQAHMLDQVGQAVIATRLDGTVIYANRSAQALYGWPIGEMRGENLLDPGVSLTPPKQAAEIMEGLRRGQAWSGEKLVRRQDGSTFPALVSDAPVLNEGGEVVAIVSVTSDMTELRVMESRARQSQKLEAVGTLAGGIAHDFNNILAAILGNAELARNALDPKHPDHESLEHIISASYRARDLIRQLLAFSRQQDNVPLVECRLEQVISEALRLLRPTLPATIQLTTDFAADLPPVMADPTQIHQVVMNLLTNSVQALNDHPGSIAVELALVRANDVRLRDVNEVCDRRCVRLSVVDTGPGMDAPTLERIFEPFFTTKEPWRGTGLGLAVVHGIVRSHGGAIQVDSRPGRGTRFDLYFPAVAARAPAATGVSAPVAPGKGERILFVDDEPALRRVGQLVLERAGYQVDAVDGSAAALEKLGGGATYDLMITDLLMPGMTGAQLAQRARELRPELTMLLSTGVGGAWTAERCREAGFAALIEKPWTGQGLALAVERALSKQQA